MRPAASPTTAASGASVTCARQPKTETTFTLYILAETSGGRPSEAIWRNRSTKRQPTCSDNPLAPWRSRGISQSLTLQSPAMQRRLRRHTTTRTRRTMSTPAHGAPAACECRPRPTHHGHQRSHTRLADYHTATHHRPQTETTPARTDANTDRTDALDKVALLRVTPTLCRDWGSYSDLSLPASTRKHFAPCFGPTAPLRPLSATKHTTNHVHLPAAAFAPPHRNSLA